uniref:Uncharacterized protein n=1 Tax=Anguilla anguilla TaxID=7936 RepID=A0A0E9U817_ANGAN
MVLSQKMTSTRWYRSLK